MSKVLLENKRFDLLTLPVKNDNTSLDIILGFSLFQLVDVDDTGEIITTSARLNLVKKIRFFLTFLNIANFFKKEWVDSSLTWNPSDYGNLEYVRLPIFSIWLPGI